jgi:hypothetical protein
MTAQDLINQVEIEDKQRLHNQVQLLKMFYPEVYRQKQTDTNITFILTNQPAQVWSDDDLKPRHKKGGAIGPLSPNFFKCNSQNMANSTSDNQKRKVFKLGEVK